MTRVALVPGVLALLPGYGGIQDPVAELRAACLEAVAWLGAEVTVLADPQGRRVADYLLAAASRAADEASYLVVGNGSAKRTEKAPGHLDERAHGFDETLGAALRSGDLTGVDLALAAELWASVDGVEQLRGLLRGEAATVGYDDDPFGVQYWVMRWELA